MPVPRFSCGILFDGFKDFMRTLLLPFRSSVLEMNAVFIVPKLLQGDKEYINLSVSSQAYVAGNRLGGTVLHVLTAFKPINLH